MIRKLLISIVFLAGVSGISQVHAQAPTPDFSANILAGCGPLSVSFKDLSTGSPLYWAWDFGNGSISSLQNPSTTYSVPGTYTVTLIARNKSGANVIQKTNYITVYPYPFVSFNSNLTLACAPANIQFNDLSTPGQGSITSWTWDLGDGTASNQQNPTHSYSQTGYYNISLTVTNSGGCSHTGSIARFLRVVDGVQPNFTWNQVSTSCIAPYVLNFINQTAGPGNMTYSWNLGNGAIPASSADTSPANITYPSSGNYTVSLLAQSSLGCNQTVQQTISFSSNNAVINGPDTVCLNAAVSFSNGSVPPPTSFTWDFGDGTGSKDPNPSKIYGTPGTYPLKLVNKYSNCADSITKNIKVVDNPLPAFTAANTVGCQAPLTVQFTDATTPAAAKWLWDFGDGTTSSQQSPSHTYTTKGLFDVKLTVTNSAGCSNTITKPQFVKIVTPTISLANAGSLGACTGSTPTFNTVQPVASVNSVDGVPATGYQWSAPGATPSTSNLVNPIFSYPTAGAYTISLTVTTNGGCTVTGTFNNVVKIGTPTTPAITATPNPTCGRDPITFDDPVTPTAEYQWSWNFGDGFDTLSNQSMVSHSYNIPKPYTVSLTLIHNGCPQVTTKTVTVNPPIPGFKYQPGCGANQFQVTFTDTSMVDPAFGAISYQWDFGDGSPVVTVNGQPGSPPPHTYPNTGTTPTPYTVTLTVTNGTCTNTISETFILGPTIAAIATVNPPICRNMNFPVISTSSNPSLIGSYSWQIDGNTPVTGNSTYTANIPTTGAHLITLMITDLYGCTSTATQSITVTGPTAQFTAPPGGCKNSPITFTDNSTSFPAGASITTWHWDFGDGTITNLTTPYTHSYADTGNYTVKLTVTDNANCTDTYTVPVPVQITAPQAFFSGPDSFYCPNTPLPFKDSSQGYGLTYSWNFGDGSPVPGPGTTDANPVHPFPTSGQTYSVTLTVTDQVGCTSSPVTNSVRIQSPIAAFTIADTTAICVPLQTIFNAQGQYYDSLYWDFGDGSTSTLPNTSHFYNTTDTFYAKLFLQGPGGCLDSATRRVLVLNPNTTTSFIYSPVAHCDSVLTNFTITPPGYTRFTLGFGDSQLDSSQNTALSHMYRNPSTYVPTLTLTDATGCIVGIAGGTPIKVLGATPFFSMDTHAFCDSGIVNFTDYTISNDGIISETFDFGDGSPISTQPGPTPNFNTDHYYDKPGTQIPSLKVETNSGCSEIYTDTLKVYQTPHPLISITGLFCTGLIQFQGDLVTPEVDADTVAWAWNFGNGGSSTQQNPSEDYASGTYTVSLRTSVSFGCNDTISKGLTVYPLPSITGPAEIITPVGFPVTIPYTYSTNVVNYSWIPPTGLSCTDCSNPIAIPTFTTLYTVTVTDSNSCVSTDSILVKTVCNDKNYFLPNTFSPNGDGVNDVFYPRGSNLYNIQSMRVFNRWGQLVFEKRNFPANTAAEGWDGTFNGRPAPSDAYVYIVEVICNNAQIVALRGDVTLIR